MVLIENRNYLKIIQEKNIILKETKQFLFNYFKDKGLPRYIFLDIINEDFINCNPSYYLYYPYLYSDYFNFKDKKALNFLSIAGFLYYKSIILSDEIFDNITNKKDFKKYYLSCIYQEESIKILSSFFDKDSHFWKIWNLRKLEYIQAYQIDKGQSKLSGFREFEQLADYKSAFGKIAIDILYYLSLVKNKNRYNDLLKSHKYFYTGFQIMDDIKDYSEDFENRQYNISKQKLTEYLRNKNEDILNYSIKNQKVLLYKFISIDLYDKTIEYLNKSLQILYKDKSSNNLFWLNEVENLYNKALTHKLNIIGFNKVYNCANNMPSVKKVSKKISKNTISLGLDYIVAKQSNKGCWYDFYNDAGLSDVWTTAYLVNVFNDFELDNKDFIEVAKSFLYVNSSFNGLWGYNSSWISDADSTSLGLLSFRDNHSTDKIFKKWLKYQKDNGGFSTYNNKNSLLASLNTNTINDVTGWMQSHFCVSAVAYNVFVELKKTDLNNFLNLRNYIKRELQSTKKVLSYWWVNDIYSFYYILKSAISVKDLEILQLCKERLDIILLEKKTLNFFLKSILLQIFCLSYSFFDIYQERIKELVEDIIDNQESNGSWSDGYFLRIPHPSVINIESENSWEFTNRGTNIITNDFNRIFTTVSCLKAIYNYEERV